MLKICNEIKKTDSIRRKHLYTKTTCMRTFALTEKRRFLVCTYSNFLGKHNVYYQRDVHDYSAMRVRFLKYN
jgi:hypothetical protein